MGPILNCHGMCYYDSFHSQGKISQDAQQTIYIVGDRQLFRAQESLPFVCKLDLVAAHCVMDYSCVL